VRFIVMQGSGKNAPTWPFESAQRFTSLSTLDLPDGTLSIEASLRNTVGKAYKTRDGEAADCSAGCKRTFVLDPTCGEVDPEPEPQPEPTADDDLPGPLDAGSRADAAIRSDAAAPSDAGSPSTLDDASSGGAGSSSDASRADAGREVTEAGSTPRPSPPDAGEASESPRDSGTPIRLGDAAADSGG
jgi:hypothetical protein